ncbi:unnamed protein product [Penicillium manginii]
MATKRIENPMPELSQLNSTSASTNPQAATTLQVLHNLQHQHLWTSLQIHASPSNSTSSVPQESRPPLISGIPPNRVYTHPDEQLYMLEQGLREDDLRPERLFVIPTAQGQDWSLRRMAAVFDSLDEITVAADDEADLEKRPPQDEKAQKLEEYYQRRETANATLEWGSKRVLLGMSNKGMGGDGTVVYYIVQEGEVKPRQN